MAISTYAQLKEAILKWGKRSDVLDLLEIFIAQAENEMYGNPDAPLRIRDMEQTATITVNTSDRYANLPAGFIQARNILFTLSHGEYYAEYRPVGMMRIRTLGPGIPAFFTVTSRIEFDTVPDQVYPVSMRYFGELTPLSDDDPTNAILTRFPNIYLFGALRQLFLWAKNEQMADYYYSQFIGTIQGANKRDRDGRYGPNPSIRTLGPTP